MFDIWMGDIELTTLILVVSVAVLLPVQMLLCFKIKRLSVRLLPVILLSALAAVFAALWFSASGWEKAGYALFAIFAGFMLFICGSGWGVWAVVNHLKKRHGRAQ